MKLPRVKIYNTLSGSKEALQPLNGKKINLFVCGPTVYDFLHIGNARISVIFDCFVKYLKQVGFEVFYLQNITDIDDKIIVRAKEKGVSPQDLATVFSDEYFKEMASLGVTAVNKYAKATDYIKEIISQVQRLSDTGYAYQLLDGIYFDISKFRGYGKLSGRTALQAEDSVSRIDYAKDKRNRGDFCLWKFETPSEPSWDSPFGKGRPGWHIEDTAITEHFFGPQYDIHGGGIDLIFPHHEAEITQMESVSGKSPLVKYWMHVGFLTMNGQKMSKSAGGMITINDFLKRYSPQQLRFLLAKSLWHSPLDYSESTMIEVTATLERFSESLRKIKTGKKPGRSAGKLKPLFKKAGEDFYTTLADDFNTPKAFAVLFEFITQINTMLEENAVSKTDAGKIYQFFVQINRIFNIIDFKKLGKTTIPNEVKGLVKVREQHRKLKEWVKSDEVREEIEKYGYTVQDTRDGQVLKKI